MSTIADASLRRLTEEQRAIAELAFAIGATYADRRFDDHDASMAQWEELAASGLTGLSLPEEYGGGRRHARALHRLRAARRGRLSGGEADHLDGDGGNDDRAPRDRRSSRSAGCPGSPPAATGSASPSPSPRRARTRTTCSRRSHADRRRVRGHRREDLHLGARVERDDDRRRARRRERWPHAPRPPDPVRERHRDAGARRCAGVRAPVERVLRRRRRAGRRRPRRARQGRPGAVRRAQPRAPRRRLAGRRASGAGRSRRPRPMPASASSSTSRSEPIRQCSTRSPSR